MGSKEKSSLVGPTLKKSYRIADLIMHGIGEWEICSLIPSLTKNLFLAEPLDLKDLNQFENSNCTLLMAILNWLMPDKELQN